MLSIHDNSRGENADHILEAFEDWLNETSPRFAPFRRYEIYGTYEVKSWFFSMWLIHQLKFFIQDKGTLIHRIVEVRKRIQRESARVTEASKYWDEDMMVESFDGVGSDASSGKAQSESISFADTTIESEDFSNISIH